MKFSPLKNDGHGSSHTPLTLDEIKQFPLGQFIFENLHSFEGQKEDQLGKLKLQTQWMHYVMLEGREVYRFSSGMNCFINEEDIPATEQQCEDIINESHKDLINQWEIHRSNEVNFFPPLLPLPIEQMPLFVSHLIQKLNSE